MTGVAHRTAHVGEVKLHYVEAGEGPVVILLHGFPDDSRLWRDQMPALVDAGFRVVAPDQRGYGLSDKPRGVAAYADRHLTNDVAGLLRAVGVTSAHVVGHDWGGIVAWLFAMRHPAMVERLVIVNVPHPARSLQAMWSPRQLLRSSYIALFTLPLLPEALMRANSGALLRRPYRGDARRPRSIADEDASIAVDALSLPGSLSAALNYYRALVGKGPKRLASDLRRIDAPTLVIWGERDSLLGRELAEPPHEWVPDVRVERLPDAGHWPMRDVPERVNELLVSFLGG